MHTANLLPHTRKLMWLGENVPIHKWHCLLLRDCFKQNQLTHWTVVLLTILPLTFKANTHSQENVLFGNSDP